jgi:hypothetical protein
MGKRPDKTGTFRIAYSEYNGGVTETVTVYRRPSGNLAVKHSGGDTLLSKFRRNESVHWQEI